MNQLLFRWIGVLRCPSCGGKLDLKNAITAPFLNLNCCECHARYGIADGIPRLLFPGRENEIEIFCATYDALRLQEGWASDSSEFYQHLPFRDLSGRHPREWALRARSFQFLQSWLEKNFGRQSRRILDIGAGSGWMSRQLAGRHDVLAIDVNAGPHGLAALPIAQRQFMSVQAELESLPLASNSFDVAVANASLHYTQNLKQFFEKISRVLRPGGKLIVMDSPTYPTRDAALAAHERTQAYYARMGVPELAQNYSGLLDKIFSEQENFRFTRVRHDFNRSLSLKKWLLEKMRKPAAARFPFWIGERLRLPEEECRIF